MITYAVISTAAAIGLAGTIVLLIKRARRLKAENVSQANTIDRLEHIVRRQQEVAREATEAREKITTGSDRERFDASLDILSDDAGSDRDHD